jgi:hypothetical protein
MSAARRRQFGEPGELVFVERGLPDNSAIVESVFLNIAVPLVLDRIPLSLSEWNCLFDSKK